MPVAYTHDHGLRTLSFYPYTQSQGKGLHFCLSISIIYFFNEVKTNPIHECNQNSFFTLWSYRFQNVDINTTHVHTWKNRYLSRRVSSVRLCPRTHLPPALPLRHHPAKSPLFLWTYRHKCKGKLPCFHGL